MISNARSGVILVTVLWTVVLLSALAMAASLTFRGFAGIMAIDQKRLKTDGLLTAGLEIAAGLASSAGDIPLRDVESTVTLASGVVRIRLNDEGGRIDIGKAPVELLAALFRSVGATDADGLAHAIVDWRKSDATAPSAQTFPGQVLSAQAAPPMATAPAANAKPPAPDSNITDVADLLQVPGMRPDWVAAVAPLVTVFGNETVNPVTAPAAVLAVLPGIDPSRLSAFLDARLQSGDPKQAVARLGPAQVYLDAKAPAAVSVRLAAVLADGYAADAAAVIVCLPKDSQPYRVLVWNPLRAPAHR